MLRWLHTLQKMIREIDRDEVGGNLGCSVVGYNSSFFFVSTVNLAIRRMFDVMVEWRDDWWTPPYSMETMVWQCEADGERLGKSLHCQGYRKSKSAVGSHKRLCKQIELKGIDALNGRQFQIKRLEGGVPRGLIQTIARRTRGLNE